VTIPPPPHLRRTRKHLSLDALLDLLREAFQEIPDPRGKKATIPLADALMSALALFSLKDPSLLAFDHRRNDENLKRLYGIGMIPCDTRMREILDPLDPDQLRPLFADVFHQLQRGKVLEPYAFYRGGYLLSLDGTGYFSSQQIHCQSCLEKVNQKTGQVTYMHQMLGAAIVHPDHKEVFPLAPEPIQKQDGSNKNDCERSASKRLLRKIRQDHPRLKLIVVEDALASNGPHVRELLDVNMHFLLGVKPGDHAYLFDHVIEAFDEERARVFSWPEGDVLCEIAFVNGVPLNEENQDLSVNFLQYSEYAPEGDRRKHFTWITDFPLTRSNARHLARGARARWRIENETFNTLKNQGYHLEHNFGHGKQNLSVVFAMLMMLAFLVDQVQQRCCPLFQAVWEKLGSKRLVWDNLRSHFRHFLFQSMEQLYETILTDRAKEVPLPVPGFDTS
jgi:hypothetical protein